MNWLLPAVGLFILLSTWDGHRKGFIRKIVGVLSLVLTLIITSVVSPYLHTFLKESTGLYHFLQNRIEGSDIELLDALRVLGHRISPADPPWPEQDRRTGAGLRRGRRPGLDLFPGHHRLRLHAGRRPASENDRPEQYPVLALSQQFAPELAGPVKMA